MTNFNTLEKLRTKEELVSYFEEKGQNITEEEIEILKKSYEQAENKNGALTMKQLDDVAGGVRVEVEYFTNYAEYQRWMSSLRDSKRHLVTFANDIRDSEDKKFSALAMIFDNSGKIHMDDKDFTVEEFYEAHPDFTVLLDGASQYAMFHIFSNNFYARDNRRRFQKDILGVCVQLGILFEGNPDFKQSIEHYRAALLAIGSRKDSREFTEPRPPLRIVRRNMSPSASSSGMVSNGRPAKHSVVVEARPSVDANYSSIPVYQPKEETKSTVQPSTAEPPKADPNIFGLPMMPSAEAMQPGATLVFHMPPEVASKIYEIAAQLGRQNPGCSVTIRQSASSSSEYRDSHRYDRSSSPQPNNSRANNNFDLSDSSDSDDE